LNEKKTKHNKTQATTVTIQALPEPSKEYTYPLVTPNYLKQILTTYSSNDKMAVLADSGLPDWHLGLTWQLHVEYFDWDDPLNTNQKQLIICDTRKINHQEFVSKRAHESIRRTIKAITDLHGANKVLISTQSKKWLSTIKKWQKEADLTNSLTFVSPEIRLSYYRSDQSEGVRLDPNLRCLVLIGSPKLTTTSAYKIQTNGYYKQEDLMKKCQWSNKRSAFLNMIGRAKDPSGTEKSIVYALGVLKEEVDGIVNTVGIQAPIVCEFPVNGAVAEDFRLVGELWLKEPPIVWNGKIEYDLPYLAMVIRKVREAGKPVEYNEIIYGKTAETRRIAETYIVLLNAMGIWKDGHKLYVASNLAV
jgi:hypothetical protein